MFRIKRLYSFILQTFLPVFLMTFFICLFIILLQFLWKYIEDMVGKGLEIKVLFELFFYAAVSMVPTSLPLSLLLASLMTFGNMGERLELTAMKAAGVSLTHIMRPLIVFITLIATGAFFFQNDIMPKAQVKLYTLILSMKQKSPELEIPEGVFYNEISGYNLFVKQKDPKTGMLHNVMIYDFAEGFENSSVILADSGKLKLSSDKRQLFLTLYQGESFANLSNQRSATANVPYRRETFAFKEILIEFDANFNRMDDNVLQGQYIGKNIAELKQSSDSIGQIIDSIGKQNSHALLKTGYFTSHPPNKAANKKDSILTATATIKLDTLYENLTPSQHQRIIGQALNRAELIKQDYEYRGYQIRDEKKLVRRHDIEMMRKFTLSFACLIFFFIGAPLGAIIRKGGLGLPAVISVVLFIIYYIIDNTGYKLARDGVWATWQGVWLSSFILLPLGIFLTYKSVNDSTILNSDTYINMFKNFIGKRLVRSITKKEVILEPVNYSNMVHQINTLNANCQSYLESCLSGKIQAYTKYWLHSRENDHLSQISINLDELIDNGSNSDKQLIIAKLSDYPILANRSFSNPIKNKKLSFILCLFFPIGLPIYLIAMFWRSHIKKDIEQIIRINKDLSLLIEQQ